jgi:hypothetical protein
MLILFTHERRKKVQKNKAASGFEPENRGFADLRLTTWLSRQKMERETGLEPATITLAT